MVVRSSLSAVRPGPVRTCVGCRMRAPKHELLRVVLDGGDQRPEVVPDPSGTMPGRGAHLHLTTACLEQALRRRALGRALRSAGAPGTARLEEHVNRQHTSQQIQQ